MNRRYLIDDVCLWCARLFAGFFAGFVAYLLPLLYFRSRVQWSMMDVVRIQLVVCLAAVAILWLVSLWNLRQASARLFLGLSAVLYLALILWELEAGITSIDWALALMFIGIPSMIWVAIRPPNKEDLHRPRA